MNNPIFIHEIKLKGESKFIDRFNNVSEMYQKAVEIESTDTPQEEKEKYWDAFVSAKYCLEQGIG